VARPSSPRDGRERLQRDVRRPAGRQDPRGHWWAINPPLPIPTWGTGQAPTLDEAKAAFQEAWERSLANHSDLEAEVAQSTSQIVLDGDGDGKKSARN
jgi:hypothetical protein